jgi:hypothetical protein
MEEEHNKVEFTGLEKRKRILASMRDLHQPLNMENILEDHKKYADIVTQRNEQHKQDLMQRQRENLESYDYQRFHGKYMERVIESDLLNKEQTMDEEERRNQIQNKMKDYYNNIKQDCKPVTSKRMVLELEKVRAELAMKPRDKILRSSPVAHSDLDDLKQIALKRKKIFEWKNEFKPPTPEPKPIYRQKNFLNQFKLDSQAEFERTGKKPIQFKRNWERDLRSEKLTMSEKFNMVREKATQLENSAKAKQQYNAIIGGTYEDTEIANDLIFDSLNAKLTLLQTSVKKDDEE